MTKKLIDNLPIITALIIILGILKLTLYYYNFSVPIKHFITLSEITTSIAEDLLTLIFCYLLIRTCFLGFSELPLKLKLSFSTEIAVLSYRLFLSLILLGLLIWNFTITQHSIRIINYTLCVFFIYLGFIKINAIKAYLERNKEVYVFITYFIIVAAMIIFETSYEIRSVTSGKYKGTVVVTNDSAYLSNDTSYYIGKTENFLFIYNSKKSTTVIPSSSIKKIDLVVND